MPKHQYQSAYNPTPARRIMLPASTASDKALNAAISRIQQRARTAKGQQEVIEGWKCTGTFF